MVFFDLDGTLLDSNGIWLDIDIAFLGAAWDLPRAGGLHLVCDPPQRPRLRTVHPGAVRSG